MRTGPHPLSVHIGMATSAWPVMSAKTGLELTEEMSGGLEKMLRGIRKYQAHPFKPDQPELPVIWEKGTVTMRKCAAVENKGDHKALLIVPSLINRSTILDLCAQRSFTRWAAAQGITSYLLDWGDVSEDAQQSDMDTIVPERLVPAIEEVAAQEDGAVSALGYCMGGTLLLAAAIHAPDKLERLVMLAVPWDFHAGKQDLLNRVRFWAPSTASYIDAGMPLPVEGIQTLFASLDPAMAARKFAKFDDMELDSDEAQLFVAVEDWLNDGVALPAQIAKDCIHRWFFANEPGQGCWQIGGQVIDPAQVKQPCLIVTSSKDKLVEYDTAAALGGVMPEAKIFDPECGHIGMIAGRDSVENVWVPIAEFLK